MPAGLSSTLIHFAPLLTTTFPCGQYFFFVLFAFPPPPAAKANGIIGHLPSSLYLAENFPSMTPRPALVALSILGVASLSALGQQDSGEVRVSVVLNTDGSRTVYENDAANHKTVATTTGKDGKMREKIRYELDENGRFARAEVLGPKEQFRFFAQYKYDANNHVIEETHFAKDQSVIGKIVFRYDATGHQIGYSTYDGAGKLLGQTMAPSATPAKKK
jgi:YD repeat-containing protein